MRTSRSSCVATLLSLAAILSLGCDDTAGPATGAIRVTVSTSGANIDPDGYFASVDGLTAQSVGVNDAITIVGLRTGTHQIQLGDLAANCTVNGANPITVDVITNDTVAAAFSVSCVATTGSLRVVTVTTGASLDPNGYSVYVDDPFYYGPRQNVASNGTVTFPDLNLGEHTVGLDEVAANCTVAGDNPRTVTVTSTATVEVTFTIQCSASGGR